MKNEEIKYMNYQMIAIGLSILAGVVSLIITYNQKLGLQKRKKILSSETTLLVTYINRIIFLITGSIFLYINYKLYEIAKIKNDRMRNSQLQLIASVLVVISELIALYVTSTSNTDSIIAVENPQI